MKVAAILFSALSLFNTAAFAYGHEHGNGGDQEAPDARSAWFLGEDVVHVCIERSTSFPVSKNEAATSLSQAVKIWNNYFQERVAKGPGSIVYANPSNAPAFNWQISLTCQGQEDLKVYLGVSNSEVALAKADYTDPVGFAYRSHYDRVKARGKGFIWIAPQGKDFSWDHKDLLLAIFLHEVGHVLGCEHEEGTIMTSRIAELLHSASISGMNTDYLRQINNNRELILSTEAPYNFHGFLTVDSAHELFGINAPTNPHAELIQTQNHKVDLRTATPNGTRELSIEFISNAPLFSNEASKAFLVYREGESRLLYWMPSGAGQVRYGKLTRANGSTSLVSLERNLGAGVILREIGDSPRIIFQSLIYEW